MNWRDLRRRAGITGPKGYLEEGRELQEDQDNFLVRGADGSVAGFIVKLLVATAEAIVDGLPSSFRNRVDIDEHPGLVKLSTVGSRVRDATTRSVVSRSGAKKRAFVELEHDHPYVIAKLKRKPDFFRRTAPRFQAYQQEDVHEIAIHISQPLGDLVRQVVAWFKMRDNNGNW